MLSEAKHLSRPPDRPFASLRVTWVLDLTSQRYFCSTAFNVFSAMDAFGVHRRENNGFTNLYTSSATIWRRMLVDNELG